MCQFLQVDVLGSAGHCQWVWWALDGFSSHWGIVGRDNAWLHWNYSQTLRWGGRNGVFQRCCLAMLMQRVTHLEALLIRCTFQICSDTIYIAMARHATDVNWIMTSCSAQLHTLLVDSSWYTFWRASPSQRSFSSVNTECFSLLGSWRTTRRHCH